ncbi:MAG: hypothetical protein NTW87_14125, partial [Planctomycetota bacterium]|nr:hypothetical protein [Planctomycetota bacterium]
GSAKPMKSSYKDGTAAAEACALMILNLLEVKNRHFTYERRRELKSPGWQSQGRDTVCYARPH